MRERVNISSLTARRTRCAPCRQLLPRLVRVCPGFGNDRPEFKSISGAKVTTQKNAAAATLYENILPIQNAADFEWPATDLADAGVRAEFLLGIFPPDYGGNHAPPPQQTPSAK